MHDDQTHLPHLASWDPTSSFSGNSKVPSLYFSSGFFACVPAIATLYSGQSKSANMSQRYYPRPPASETGASTHTLSGETTVEGQQPRVRPATNLFSDSSQGFGSDSGRTSQRPWMPPHHIPISPVQEDEELPPPLAHGAANGGFGVETRILIGLDFGTTYTGTLAMKDKKRTQTYTVPAPGLAVFHQAADATFSLGSIEVFTEWDGGDTGAAKVPSVISYSESEAGMKQWGSDIDINEGSWASHWTKLDLPKQTPLQELSTLRRSLESLMDLQRLGSDNHDEYETPEHLTRSPEEIVQDFLTFIARHYYLKVKEKSQFVLTSLPIDMVLTHPAVSTSMRNPRKQEYMLTRNRTGHMRQPTRRTGQ